MKVTIYFIRVIIPCLFDTVLVLFESYVGFRASFGGSCFHDPDVGCTSRLDVGPIGYGAQ